MSSDPTSSTRTSAIYYYASFLVFGGIGTTAGATLPMVIRHFEWSYLAAGWIFAASAVGYFLSTFVTGMVLPYWGIRRLMVVGLLLQAIGIGGFGFWASLPVNMAMFVVLGLGQGAVEVSTNVGGADRSPWAESLDESGAFSFHHRSNGGAFHGRFARLD